MALGDILAAIRAEADAEAERVGADAGARAAGLLERARIEAEGEREQLAHSRDDVARVTRQRVTSRAHLKAARIRRDARERFYQTVHDEAALRLEGIRLVGGLSSIQGQLLDEAISVLPSATTLCVDPRDVEMTRSLLEERGLEIDVEPSNESWGGVVLVDGGRTVRNDLRSRLERADDHLRAIAGSVVPQMRGEGP